MWDQPLYAVQKEINKQKLVSDFEILTRTSGAVWKWEISIHNVGLEY